MDYKEIDLNKYVSDLNKDLMKVGITFKRQSQIDFYKG
jgi:hypothetical protein